MYLNREAFRCTGRQYTVPATTSVLLLPAAALHASSRLVQASIPAMHVHASAWMRPTAAGCAGLTSNTFMLSLLPTCTLTVSVPQQLLLVPAVRSVL
jgi:hypothetical protein